MNVAIIGTGYVGLVTGACLAHLGHHVTCVDMDCARVAALLGGRSPIHEEGLDGLLAAGVAAGSLTATIDLAAAAAEADLVMICVGTPSREGRIDLSAVGQACRQLGEALRGRRDRPVVVVKSTVTPGTTGGLVRQELEAASGLAAGVGFGLAMNPEFLSQGTAVADFLEPDRIVIGALDDHAAAALLALYDGFSCPKVVTSLINAELAKYAANAFQATLISFANQIAAICENLPGADEKLVMRTVHLDRNLTLAGGDGPHPAPAIRFLQGGIGFGGSCFPKDLAAFGAFAGQIGAQSRMLDAVIETNRRRPEEVVQMLRSELGGLAGRVVVVLGLAFKPHTDDLRESPGLSLIRRLDEAGAAVRAHDPLAAARANARPLLGAIPVMGEAEDALSGAHAAVIATAWPDYAAWDWPRLAGIMRTPLVLDGRGLLAEDSLAEAAAHGVRIRRVGTGPEERQPEAPLKGAV